MHINKLLSTLILFFISTFTYAQIVTNETELNNAISAATPGTTIILADGTWNNVFIDINKNGTSAAPITITAQNVGAVFMTGNSRVYMRGSYVTVSGLIFQNPANLILSGSTIEPVFELNQCDYCKLTNNKIDTYNGTEAQKTIKFKWVYIVDGQHNEIAYNSFIGKYGIGSIINDNRGLSNADYLKIHHNYFADRTPINGVTDDNDQDAIRIGTSTTSLSDSYSEVYDNYFYNFFGEIEVISNKSGQNKYYNNTFRKYSGCLTLRHGNNCEVYGNYFFAENNSFSGGVRVIGEDHKVYNNYIEGINSFKPNGSSSNVTGGINIMNGLLNSPLNGYYQVKNAQVVNNTFVNCDYALRVGTVINGNDQEPINLTIGNNIMYNTSINAYQIVTAPSGSSISEGNLTNVSSGDMADDGNFHKLTSGSAPIDAGLGTYSFLIQDILEGNRDANFDAGAEEFGAGGTKLPYVTADVGVNIGFGAAPITNPVLSVSPSTLNFSDAAGTLTFELTSNVDWTITENLSWLSLDITSGTGTTTVTLTVTENTTGTERTGSLSIDEIAGGSDLSATLSVLQNSFTPLEIPIIGTSSVGMQQSNPQVAEAHAYNDDNTNYWTGNPDTEPEVSITFDLSCPHILTEIGINFWKADERTTTFSIAVANDAAGPFTTIINTATSAETGVTVDTEQFFSLNNTVARYVKFIGIGNSSSSNWTSIANVNIYGNLNCYEVCETPTGPFATDILADRAVISAGETGFADRYYYRYRENGVTGPSTFTLKIRKNGNPFTLNNLVPGIEYQMNVRVRCDDGSFTDWSEDLIFSTSPCFYPNPIDVTLLLDDRFRLEWTAIPLAEKYQIWYRPLGSTDSHEKIVTVNPFRTILDLVPGTTYQYRVRTLCEYGWSYLSPQAFVTTTGSTSIEDGISNEFSKSSRLGENITLYPNPVSDLLYIEIPKQIYPEFAEILDINGHQILKVMSEQLEKGINISELPRGTYSFMLIDLDGNRTMKRFVKL